MAIEFEELEGSPKIVIGSTAANAQRTFRIAWADWPAFANLVVGGWKKTGRAYRRIPPLEFPGFPDVIVHEITIEPFDQFAPTGDEIETIERGTNSYPIGGARVTAHYRSIKSPNLGLEPTIPAGTYLNYEFSVAEEILPTASSAWVWTDDDTTVPDTVKTDIHIPLNIMKLNWHFVPLPPWPAIRTLRGRVNNAEFFGAQVGTVLFLGARFREEFSFLAGPSVFSLEYCFAERSHSWNGYMKPGASYTDISRGASGPHPHSSGNFQALFAFGAE